MAFEPIVFANTRMGGTPTNATNLNLIQTRIKAELERIDAAKPDSDLVAKVVDIDAGQEATNEGLEIVREGEDVTFYLNGEEL